MEKPKHKVKIKRPPNKMSGGKEEAIPWDSGGTGITDLPNDIIGVIVHTINTIINANTTVNQIVGLPANMGTAFSSPTDPNPNDVDITGM